VCKIDVYQVLDLTVFVLQPFLTSSK